MNALLFVSRLLLRHSIRSKVFGFLAFAALFLMMASLILGEMVIGRPGKAVWDLGLSTLNLIGLAFVVTFGVSLSSPQQEGRILPLLLVKPLGRRGYLGALFVTLLSLNLIAALLVLPLTWALLGFPGDALPVLLTALYWQLLEMAVMAALTLFFSMLTSPQLALFLSLCFYAIGHSLTEALKLVAQSGKPLSLAIVRLLYTLLPNLSHFNHKSALASGRSALVEISMLWGLLYAICCVLLWGGLAVKLFSRREL